MLAIIQIFASSGHMQLPYQTALNHNRQNRFLLVLMSVRHI